MNNATVVRVSHGIGDLEAVAEHLLDRHAVRRDHAVERLPGDQLHRDVDLSAGLADFMDSADMRMVQCGGRFCFAEQTCACGRIGERRGGQYLDRDIPVESLIVGAKTSPMPPAPSFSITR